MKNKIGIGITTCNREHALYCCLESIFAAELKYDKLVVVNDGEQLKTIRHIDGKLIDNEINLGIAKSKNKALQYLMDAGCEHIFLIEDDIIFKHVLCKDVLQEYINMSLISGIKHLNYALGTPFNHKQNTSFDLHNRHELSLDSEPNPKLILDYGNRYKIALYEHISGMFSYYHRSVIEKIGYLDEQYKNAWEHVDHTYQAIKAGFHPPFWYFADIANSDKYIEPQKDSIENSTTSKNTKEWIDNVWANAEKYRIKNGQYPAQTPLDSQENVIEWIKQHKSKNE